MSGKTRLKYLVTVNAGQAPPSSHIEALDSGLPFIQGCSEFAEFAPSPRLQCNESPKVAEPGSVLLSVRAPVGEVNWALERIGIGRGVCELRPRTVDAKYLFWLLHSSRQALESNSTGSTFMAVDSGTVGNLTVPCVTLERQQSTADYLDYETEQIDEFIADQEQLIELLTERRQGVCDSVVVTGFETVQTRRIVSQFQQGLSPQASASQAGSAMFGVVKAGCVNGGVFNENENKELPSSFNVPSDLVIKSGDVLINRANGSLNYLGSVGLVGNVSANLMLCDKVYRVSLTPGICPRFFWHWAQSKQYRDQVMISHSGAQGLAKNISMSALRSFQIPLPSREEQERIVAELDRELGEIDEMIADAKLAVELSKEKRAALITAAVTGEIDVSDWQRPDGWLPPHERPVEPVELQ